jgi:hypothetical protein
MILSILEKAKRINDWLKARRELSLVIGLIIGMTVGNLL